MTACSWKSTCAVIPAALTMLRSCISPHAPRTCGRFSAETSVLGLQPQLVEVAADRGEELAHAALPALALEPELLHLALHAHELVGDRRDHAGQLRPRAPAARATSARQSRASRTTRIERTTTMQESVGPNPDVMTARLHDAAVRLPR